MSMAGKTKAKLTPDQVREIRRMGKAGVIAREIAQIYCMSADTIRKILRREMWPDVHEDGYEEAMTATKYCIENTPNEVKQAAEDSLKRLLARMQEEGEMDMIRVAERVEVDAPPPSPLDE